MSIVWGMTNDQVNTLVDVLKVTALSLLKRFAINGESLEVKIVWWSMPPEEEAKWFLLGLCKTLKPIQLMDPGKIKCIRGAVYSIHVSPQMTNWIGDSARNIFNKFMPNIYVYTDHRKGVNSGMSPGFGLWLVTGTTNGIFFSAELASYPRTREQSHYQRT